MEIVFFNFETIKWHTTCKGLHHIVNTVNFQHGHQLFFLPVVTHARVIF